MSEETRESKFRARVQEMLKEVVDEGIDEVLDECVHAAIARANKRRDEMWADAIKRTFYGGAPKGEVLPSGGTAGIWVLPLHFANGVVLDHIYGRVSYEPGESAQGKEVLQRGNPFSDYRLQMH